VAAVAAEVAAAMEPPRARPEVTPKRSAGTAIAPTLTRSPRSYVTNARRTRPRSPNGTSAPRRSARPGRPPRNDEEGKAVLAEMVIFYVWKREY